MEYALKWVGNPSCITYGVAQLCYLAVAITVDLLLPSSSGRHVQPGAPEAPLHAADTCAADWRQCYWCSQLPPSQWRSRWAPLPARAAERIGGGGRANTKSGAHNLDCVSRVWGQHASRKFCNLNCSWGFWHSFCAEKYDIQGPS